MGGSGGDHWLHIKLLCLGEAQFGNITPPPEKKAQYKTSLLHPHGLQTSILTIPS